MRQIHLRNFSKTWDARSLETPTPIKRLVDALSRLPGIGEKSATRLAFFLLSAPENSVDELATSIKRIKEDVLICEACFDLTEKSPCAICSDDRRNPAMICVVEEPADRLAIERSGSYSGRYHVLGGALSPIDGIGPEDVRIAELLKRVDQENVQEVVLASNPTSEGDATAHYIADLLKDKDVLLTRIASGMPLGGDLEYADQVTVARSLRFRRELE